MENVKFRREALFEVLKSKYNVEMEDGTYFKEKQRPTQLWKGIVLGTELLRRGLQWKVHDGEMIFF